MIRTQVHSSVKYGMFREYLELSEEIDELSRQRGWTVCQHWAQTAGPINRAIAEATYPDFASFEREQAAMDSDPEHMKLRRRLADYVVEGSVTVEVQETAPHLA